MTAVQADVRLVQVRRVLVWAIAVELAALLATGVYLAFFYRPTAAQAWNDIYELHREVTLALIVRTIHRWLSWATLGTALLLGAILVAEGASRWRGAAHRRRGIATGPVMAVLIAATAYTGTLLPWDQLALWAVTVGTNMSGFRPLFDDQARFVLIGGSEVSLGTIRTVLLIHTVVLPAVIVGLLVFSSRRSRREVEASGGDLDPDPDGRDHQDVVIAATSE